MTSEEVSHGYMIQKPKAHLLRWQAEGLEVISGLAKENCSQFRPQILVQHVGCLQEVVQTAAAVHLS